MTRVERLEHRFVEFVPGNLELGVLYVSIEYATVVHACACGCSGRVITPLTPTDWRLTFDGETVSLWPSIGNWSFPCQSHYWITYGRIEWARRWSPAEIQRGRQQARLSRDDSRGAPATELSRAEKMRLGLVRRRIRRLWTRRPEL